MITPDHTAALTEAAQTRAAAERAATAAQAAFAETVAWAHERGATEVEIAGVLGVSQQRVSQVVAAGRALHSDRLY